MFWFEYKYKSPEYIIENIKLLSEFSILEYVILWLSVLWFLIMFFYLLPYFYIVKKYMDKEKEKRNKRNFIKQIALQKDIEEEIEKEMSEVEKKKLWLQ